MTTQQTIIAALADDLERQLRSILPTRSPADEALDYLDAAAELDYRRRHGPPSR